MAHALIDGKNTVVNVIEYDGTSEYTPPSGQELVDAPDGTAIGDVLDGKAINRQPLRDF